MLRINPIDSADGVAGRFCEKVLGPKERARLSAKEKVSIVFLFIF